MNMIPGLTGKKERIILKQKTRESELNNARKLFFCYFKKPLSTAQEFLLLMTDKRQLFIILGWLFTTNRVKTVFNNTAFLALLNWVNP